MNATTDVVEAQDTVFDSDDEPQSPKKAPLPLRAIDQQRLSHYILTQRDRPISSFESMKKFLETPDDVDSRIDEQNEQYGEDLDRLYTALTEEYLDEAEDRYYAFDDRMLPDNDIEALYRDLHSENSNAQHSWDYAIAYTAHTHHTRLEEITRHIKATRRLVEMDFPQSIQEYRLKPKDNQHRAARFLVLESDEQREKMLTEFGWAWRQVTPLKTEFEANEVCFFSWSSALF
ncbi:hypothetical protein C8R45DRAFT_837457 [Mycena sanguinolenta]|nr:hypothetical protein C8R45DRAFT_837457 [Mycena sanguinolenta]